MRIVEKYGGTSLADPACIARAARRAVRLHRQGHQVVLVVSAQGDTTDVLLGQAEAVCPEPKGRELDALLAAGEQMSAALVALAIQARGVPAVSFTGWQAGIRTDGCFGNAKIQAVEPKRILEALTSGCVAVAAGFQGIAAGEITTLGRGGSDTTAVALAAALKADRCRIRTDVDGVYDRDPRHFPDARRFDRIGYDRMLRLARSGAQVLHNRCVELAQREQITLEVCSAFSDRPGTLVCKE